MGKSASGKDTIYDRLLHKEGLPLLPYVGYTTRPIRAGEQDGVEYYFTTKEDLDRYKEEGKLIESRVYHTVTGIITVWTVTGWIFPGMIIFTSVRWNPMYR